MLTLTDVVERMRKVVEVGESPSRMKALLVLSNLIDFRMIEGRELSWLFQLVGEVPERWTMNDYSIALPMLRRVGYDISETTCLVWRKAPSHERAAIAEWIARNAESLSVRTHIHVVPIPHPQST